MSLGLETTIINPPPLESGDRLKRDEFERRYANDPNVKKAELIEGVVYVASPLRFYSHANPHAIIMGWLSTYWFATPGTLLADNPTLRLDGSNEPQPDAVLFIERSGRVQVTEDDYLQGAPELIVEIAGSSASYDLTEKKAAYQRNGVQEYIVWCTRDRSFQWFALENGVYVELLPDGERIIRSRVFPGLWLNLTALLTGELPQVLAVVQQGIATSSHQEFWAQFP